MDKQALQALTYGYNLDGGGYEFENPPKLFGDSVAMLDDPDLDYIVGHEAVPNFNELSCPQLMLAPNYGFGNVELPLMFTDADGDIMSQVATGYLNTTERECHCHGRLVPWTGAAGEPKTPVGPLGASWVNTGEAIIDIMAMGDIAGGSYFEHTGDTGDKPYPLCHRCEGDGYVDSPGGVWAVYAVDEDGDAKQIVTAVLSAISVLDLTRTQFNAAVAAVNSKLDDMY